MGYLNNTTRVLDAILTKKGRELLSSGADFTVTKFALGDDEIDYSLWDTTHTLGTDYYGAAIDNLPALEPFNDPSEIMKYKVVTRQTVGCRAMAKLNDSAGTGQLARTPIEWDQTADPEVYGGGLIWYAGETNIITVAGGLATGQLGGGANPGGGRPFGVAHQNNIIASGGKTDYKQYAIDAESNEGVQETFTVTLLDASVACLAPVFNEGEIATTGQTAPQLARWVPFVDNVQHISQTIRNVGYSSGTTFNCGFIDPDPTKSLYLYPKQISDAHVTNPAKTSIIITGEISGAVIVFPVTIHYVA
jgi:hypothetical protein